MRGWCPRCDAVREAEGTCPECQAPLIELDERPVQPAARPAEEAVSEVSAVAEPPPRGRLRAALAVAAVVLMGLAFVAGRSTGGPVATAQRSSSTTTQTTAPQRAELQRRLGWRSKPSRGVRVEAVSLSRIPSDTVDGDVDAGENAGSLTLRVDGLGGRRLLGIAGLRLIDSGGGVFAEPDSRQIGGVQAVPVQPAGPAGSYLVDLGPTPAVDTLTSVEFDSLLLSASSGGRTQLELRTDGAWPARPPMRAVDPSSSRVSVPVARADGGAGDLLPLRVVGAFVGAGRAVVVLSLAGGAGGLGGGLGAFPVSADLRDGKRVVCSRQTVIGRGRPQVFPLLVVDCPTSPAPSLAVEVVAGVDAVRFGANLKA